ncbi:hypothetical protein GRI69_04095 [Erythrobacter vulgaris]|uniref:Lipocalin-like domain-containing protein n=1 Tax=Qipengyuania vulgaris TaxID=291985 RepID=A0A844XPN7_9SPHN|nr:hypothetical protein [Qipengyuania vulgaris]MXO47436.1 hypothetical protein [Qipengyuania vulgaris]
MKQVTLLRSALPTALLALAACSQDPQAPVDSEVAAEGTADDADVQAQETSLADAAEEGPTAQVNTMPAAMLGRWHEDALGRAPTAADCDPESDATRDYDRLITVRETGYGYFETGGRIMEVHDRNDRMIDATFDTTYADTPTQARKDFSFQANGSLVVQDDSGEESETIRYQRCPE